MRKKLLLKLFAFSICAFVLFSSCLDSSGSSSSGYANGILRQDVEKSKMLLDVVVGGVPVSFYSPQFDQLKAGDCYSVNYEVDFKQAENMENVVKLTGYYVVSISHIEGFEKLPLYHELVDTAQVLENEFPVNEIAFIDYGISYPYVKGCLFSCHFTNQPPDQQTKWWLSYDADHLSEENQDGVVYDLFLRATIEQAGKKPESKMFVSSNAYEMEHYMSMIAEREKAAGRKGVKLRISYVSEIKEGVLIWKKSISKELTIESIL